MAVPMAARMSVRGAGWMAVHLICWLFDKLVGCWAAGIVLARVDLMVGEKAMTWVYLVVILMAVDWVH